MTVNEFADCVSVKVRLEFTTQYNLNKLKIFLPSKPVQTDMHCVSIRSNSNALKKTVSFFHLSRSLIA